MELLYIYQIDVMLFIITEFDLYTALYSFVHVWCLKSSAETFSSVLFHEICQVIICKSLVCWMLVKRMNLGSTVSRMHTIKLLL